MSQVTLHDLVKQFSEDVIAVNNINLEIQDKEFVVLVGPSGCGKTTTLRMVAGLEDVTAGEVFIGDRLVNDVPPKDRNIAMVFQNYALYPHMTVYKNMAFSLKLRKTRKDEIDRRVRARRRLARAGGARGELRARGGGEGAAGAGAGAPGEVRGIPGRPAARLPRDPRHNGDLAFLCGDRSRTAIVSRGIVVPDGQTGRRCGKVNAANLNSRHIDARALA